MEALLKLLADNGRHVMNRTLAKTATKLLPTPVASTWSSWMLNDWWVLNALRFRNSTFLGSSAMRQGSKDLVQTPVLGWSEAVDGIQVVVVVVSGSEYGISNLRDEGFGSIPCISAWLDDQTSSQHTSLFVVYMENCVSGRFRATTFVELLPVISVSGLLVVDYSKHRLLKP